MKIMTTVAVLLVCALAIALITSAYFFYENETLISKANTKWCIDRGYAAARVSASAGKSSINQVICGRCRTPRVSAGVDS